MLKFEGETRTLLHLAMSSEGNELPKFDASGLSSKKPLLFQRNEGEQTLNPSLTVKTTKDQDEYFQMINLASEEVLFFHSSYPTTGNT